MVFVQNKNEYKISFERVNTTGWLTFEYFQPG